MEIRLWYFVCSVLTVEYYLMFGYSLIAEGSYVGFPVFSLVFLYFSLVSCARVYTFCEILFDDLYDL